MAWTCTPAAVLLPRTAQFSSLLTLPVPSASIQRLGGVYPLAQFADRLIESLQANGQIGVRFDSLNDPNGRRHAPALTYLLTELLCAAAGGPEVVTAKSFEEARLGVPSEQWGGFCALAADAAAAVFPTAHHRATVRPRHHRTPR